MSVLEPEIYYSMVMHPVAYGLCVRVAYLVAADSLVPPQPPLTYAGEVITLCG